MRKEYVKPSMRLVDWNFQDPVCNTVYQQSPCVHVIGDEGGKTHIDHRGTWGEGDITWKNWEN